MELMLVQVYMSVCFVNSFSTGSVVYFPFSLCPYHISMYLSCAYFWIEKENFSFHLAFKQKEKWKWLEKVGQNREKEMAD